MLTKRAIVLAKIESTYNVDPVPVAADNAIRVFDPSWNNEGARRIERQAKMPTMGQLQKRHGGHLKALSLSAEVKGTLVAYSASDLPAIDPFLRACGFSANLVTTPGSETVEYLPATENHESITLYYYEDRILHKLTGSRGNVSFKQEAGARLMSEFSFIGHTVPVADVTFPTTAQYDNVPPIIFLGAGFTTHSYAARINSFSFDVSNQVTTGGDANASDGFSEVRIVDRDVNGSFDPENILVATHDFIGRWQNDQTGVIATGAIGTAQYNRVTFSFPRTYYDEVAAGDRDGVITRDIGFRTEPVSGDDEVSILFS